MITPLSTSYPGQVLAMSLVCTQISGRHLWCVWQQLGVVLMRSHVLMCCDVCNQLLSSCVLRETCHVASLKRCSISPLYFVSYIHSHCIYCNARYVPVSCSLIRTALTPVMLLCTPCVPPHHAVWLTYFYLFFCVVTMFCMNDNMSRVWRYTPLKLP